MKFQGHFLSLFLHAPHNPSLMYWRQRFTHSCERLHACNIICDIVSLSNAVAMVIKAQFDFPEAIWVIDLQQLNCSMVASARLTDWTQVCNGSCSIDPMILCLPQPLGSFPHMCPHSAVRLSAGSQLHLGDAKARLKEDALPGESVWPVQPQLLSQHTITPECPHPAPDRHADHDLVLCIDEGGAGGFCYPDFSPPEFKLKAKDFKGTNVLMRVSLMQSLRGLWRANQNLL